MADIQEELIADWQAQFPGFHVGEQVPDTAAADYIWLQQTGETESEDLCENPRVNQTFFDVEISSPVLDTVRNATPQLKTRIRTYGKYPAAFTGVEAMAVTDHDDNYTFKSLPEDQRQETSALSLTIHWALPGS